ncbi:hypothetical protein QQS21_008085 [Conoideocrella luteorostrata]|uniref:F-box domain-containing protein n=1 Tax=Conoideocrella luteorostrata TaxID=1105319 RepID=A0AAJ0CJH8_9HYPO|nr:hypothetical protein QQS21_008085 [Conoideocrella luteorostrata]
MQPTHPAAQNSQLMVELQFGLASLPHSPALSALEGVRIEQAIGSAPHYSDDEVASQLLSQEAIDAQPCSASHYDSCEMAVTGSENCRLYHPGNGHDDAVQGDSHIWAGRTAMCHGITSALVRSTGSLDSLPNEVLLHVLGFLDVSDLLATSRTSHLLRSLSLAPILHHYRLRRTRQVLPPLLTSPGRPTVADLIARSIFLTQTSVVSRRLAWSLNSIRLSKRLAARPSAKALVERCVLPKECVPGMVSVHIAPALVAKRKAIEKERVKDGLRRWIAGKWKGEVREREEELKRCHENRGIGRVWKLTKFWERVSRGDELPSR